MSSVSTNIKCWLCPEEFEKNTEMKNHAIVYHSVCRLICPWCNEDEKTFVRMSELAKHSKRRHHDLVLDLLDGEFFTEKNGFWLSTRPSDYQKIVKASEWTSLISIRTRAAVLGWVERMGEKSSRTREQWEEGWQEALHQPVNSTSSRKRKYSPSRPSIDLSTIVICSISLSSKGNLALMKTTERNATVWYKVELVHWIVEDKRAMENLMRRMMAAQKGQELGAPKDFVVELKDSQETIKQLATALGITEKHVRRVYRGTVQIIIKSKSSKTEQKDAPRKDKVKEKVHVEKKTDRPLKENENVQQMYSTEVKHTQDFGEEPEFEIVDSYEEETVVERERIAVIKGAPVESESTISEKTPASSESNIIDNEEESRKEPEGEQEVPINKESLDNYVSMLSDDEDRQSTQIDTIESTKDCRVIEVREEDPYEMETDEDEPINILHNRAECLLKAGGMPLFPPGRRQWSNQRIIISTYPTPMYWPPNNWKTLSPEQKLTAWRFAATSLSREKGLDGSVNERDILDNYAMLALPGTAVPSHGGEDNIIKARMANYKVLTNILNGQISGCEAEQWLYSFEVIGKGENESRLVELLKDVPLRVYDSK